MEIGPQYESDDGFKVAARLHQSKYRAEVLKVGYKNYGNRLTKPDAMALLNYHDKLNCRQVLRERYPSYSKKRDADMLRSEHIPFNLLAPLDTNREAAIGIIGKAFGVACAEIELIEVEYAPDPKALYLNDGTAFDTYILVKKADGTKCGIGIEVKYTEQAYRIGNAEAKNVNDHQSRYWQVARASGCFTDPDDRTFGEDDLRQIWRNHLLGLSMIQRGDIDEFYSITLYPAGNTHFHEVMPQYTQRLEKNAQASVLGCTFEKYIASISGTPEFDDWKEWLERRYVVSTKV